MIDIDSAIIHMNLKSIANNKLASVYLEKHLDTEAKECQEKAEEYSQIAEWLREVKMYKCERVGCEFCKHNFREQHERPCSLCKHNFLDMFEE